jgi:protoheme IX farnesyltransferase
LGGGGDIIVSTQTGLKETGTTDTRTATAWVSVADRLGSYWALIKSLQTLLLLATGVAGYLTARPHSASPVEVVWMLLSLFAAVSGTTALNMVFDRDIDARMERTAGRPLPRGTVSPAEAALFGGVLVALGLGIALWMRPAFALVVAAGVLLDLVVYTVWLKRRSPWSIAFGGISGGMPILAGRALGIGRVDGLGILLALSVLTWIPAHIMTLAMKYADDYRRAGVPTWPTVRGFDSARRFIAVANGLRIGALIGAGWLLRICPYSLGLLGVSGTAMLGLSLWAAWRPSARLNYALFKFASVHMLGSMVLITLGAIV